MKDEFFYNLILRVTYQYFCHLLVLVIPMNPSLIWGRTTQGVTSRRWESDEAILDAGHHRHVFEREKADDITRIMADAQLGTIVPCIAPKRL